MEEVIGNIDIIDTNQYYNYFAYLRDIGYEISFADTSITIIKDRFNTFTTDDVKDELIPILIMIGTKYKVSISVIGDFNGIQRKLNFNKFINEKVYQDNLMSITLFLSVKKENILHRLRNFFEPIYEKFFNLIRKKFLMSPLERLLHINIALRKITYLSRNER